MPVFKVRVEEMWSPVLYLLCLVAEKVHDPAIH